MSKIYRVKVRKHTHSDSAHYYSYTGSVTFRIKDLETLPAIKFFFHENVGEELKEKILNKWQHKVAKYNEKEG